MCFSESKRNFLPDYRDIDTQEMVEPNFFIIVIDVKHAAPFTNGGAKFARHISRAGVQTRGLVRVYDAVDEV